MEMALSDIKKNNLSTISTQTIDHYNGKSEQFWQGTKDHDVTQNINSLLKTIEGEGPHHILDFGCGPGRDLEAFTTLGHKATGLDGCENFVQMARDFSKCDVLHQDFISLNLESNIYDGIFANASLFHVPSTELLRVLKELRDSLKDNGILFSSNPRGNEEGWNGQRWGHYMELDTYREFLELAGFSLVDHYYRPQGMPIDQCPWLACLAKKN
jgi:SAM-dependent methyltransferase